MKVGNLHEGLKNRSPKSDSGMKPSSASVNDNATRSSVAKTPRTLGPREA